MNGLPRYLCHKEVRAGKVIWGEHCGGQSFRVQVELPDGSRPMFQYEHKGAATNVTSMLGMYLVQYKDGYASLSPAEAFETGYTLIQEPLTVPEDADLPGVVKAAKRGVKAAKP